MINKTERKTTEIGKDWKGAYISSGESAGNGGRQNWQVAAPSSLLILLVPHFLSKPRRNNKVLTSSTPKGPPRPSVSEHGRSTINWLLTQKVGTNSSSRTKKWYEPFPKGYMFPRKKRKEQNDGHGADHREPSIPDQSLRLVHYLRIWNNFRSQYLMRLSSSSRYWLRFRWVFQKA